MKLQKDISDDFILLLDITYGAITGILFGAKHINIALYFLSIFGYVIFRLFFMKSSLKEVFLIMITSIFSFIIGRSFYNKKINSREVTDEHEKEIDKILKECAW